MDFVYFIGWDCSKATLDYTLLNQNGERLAQGQIANTITAIAKLTTGLLEQHHCTARQLLHCCENTGRYSNPLKAASAAHQLCLWVEDALQLKLSCGRIKDKTDELDAQRIAHYCRRYADQAQLFVMPNRTALKIKNLSRKRQVLVEQLAGWKANLNEGDAYELVPTDPSVKAIFDQFVGQMEMAIKQIDQQLLRLIQSDATIKRKYDIVKSVPGMGAKNTVVLIAETELFTKLATARALASYAGLRPRTYQSGTSVKRKSRTSQMCNKTIKTALHLGAISLIRRDNEFSRKYHRLIARGKTALQAINAVRNKMVRVIYACLESDTTYNKNTHLSLHIP